MLATLFLFLCSVSVFSVSHAQSATQWWSMFRHDATHTGYSTSTGPNTNQTRWIYATGSMADFSPPTVVDGRVYIGSFDTNVYCLESVNGDLVWKNATSEYVSSSPAVADGKLYFGSFDDIVYCLDALNGDLIWKYATGGGIGGAGCPAVADGTVYVGSSDGSVYAFGLNIPTPTPTSPSATPTVTELMTVA